MQRKDSITFLLLLKFSTLKKDSIAVLKFLIPKKDSIAVLWLLKFLILRKDYMTFLRFLKFLTLKKDSITSLRLLKVLILKNDYSQWLFKVFQNSYFVECWWTSASEGHLSYHIYINERDLLWVLNLIALGSHFLFEIKFPWNEGINTCFNVKCVLLGRNFNFLGGYILVTPRYWWLHLVTTRYYSLPLLVWSIWKWWLMKKTLLIINPSPWFIQYMSFKKIVLVMELGF